MKKMATQPDQSSSSNSVLTNVAPPSALPSFLTSPLPSNTPSVPPPTVPSIPPPTVPSIPPPTFPQNPPPPSTSSMPPLPSAPQPLVPPTTSSSAPAGSYTSHTPPAAPSGSTFVPNKVSSFPVPSPPSNSGTPPAESPPQTNMAVPVTSQPHTPTSPGSGGSGGGVDTMATVDIGTPGVPAPGAGGDGSPGWLGWIRGTVSNVGHRVAERAKTSMDSMITTLDPQMKEFIYSGGDVDVVVASDKEVKVGAIREAFQITFGKATVCGIKGECEGVAAQPVGFEAALNSAEGRINALRSSGKIHPQQPIIAVENFIVEFQTDCWFDIGLLLLDDPGEDIVLQTYTQVTPVPPDFVNQARSATPDDYPLKESGFAVTIGQIASQNLQVHHTMWQEALTGVSRRECLVLAGRTLAGLYRTRLPKYH